MPVFLHMTDEGVLNLLRFAEEGIPRPVETYCGKKYLFIHRPNGLDGEAIRRLMNKYGCGHLFCCYPETLPPELRSRHVLPLARGKIRAVAYSHFLHIFQNDAQ